MDEIIIYNICGLLICLFILHYSIGIIFSNKLEIYRKSNIITKHQWKNYTVSSIYTTIIAILSGTSLYTIGFYQQPSAILEFTLLHKRIILSMIAYLMYDSMCILYSMRLNSGAYESPGSSEFGKLFHHILGIVPCFICLVTQIGSNTMLWTFFSELSTPFMSLRWMLLSAGYKGTMILKGTEILFAVTFTGSRIINIPFLLKYLWSTRNIWKPVWVFNYMLLTGIIFYGMNIFWFIKIIKKVRNELKYNKKLI